jgi:hypothetical protein
MYEVQTEQQCSHTLLNNIWEKAGAFANSLEPSDKAEGARRLVAIR